MSTTLTSITNVTVESVLSSSANLAQSSGGASMTIRKVGYEPALDVVWHATELLRARCQEGLIGSLRNSLFYDLPLGISHVSENCQQSQL